MAEDSGFEPETDSRRIADFKSACCPIRMSSVRDTGLEPVTFPVSGERSTN